MTYIHHSQFNPTKLILKTIATKEMSYSRCSTVSIMYEYESKNGHKSIAPLNIKGPELYSPNGIQLRSVAQKVNASLYTSFDVTNPEVASFVSPNGFWHKLYNTLADYLWNTRDALKLNIKKKTFMESIFKFPIKFVYDDNGDIIPDRNPSKYFSLDISKERHTIFSTPLQDDKYRKLSRDILQDVSMTFKPIIAFEKLFVVNEKVFLRDSIKSVIVSSFTKRSIGLTLNDFDILLDDIKSLSLEGEWMAPPAYCLSDVNVEYSEPPPYSEIEYNKEVLLNEELPPPYEEV